MEKTMILNDVSQLQFPVMCLWDRFVRVRTTVERLTATKMAGLRHGMFRDMLIVDSNGNQILVAGARKKCGYGWLWGWNLFLNQRIRVKLELTSLQQEVGIEELKTRLRSFWLFKVFCGTRRGMAHENAHSSIRLASVCINAANCGANSKCGFGLNVFVVWCIIAGNSSVNDSRSRQ